METVRIELHQRIAVHEQETVVLKNNAATAELKHSELIVDHLQLMKDIKALTEDLKKIKIQFIDEQAKNTRVRSDSEDERAKGTPDWQKRFENELKPNQELGDDELERQRNR